MLPPSASCAAVAGMLGLPRGRSLGLQPTGGSFPAPPPPAPLVLGPVQAPYWYDGRKRGSLPPQLPGQWGQWMARESCSRLGDDPKGHARGSGCHRDAPREQGIHSVSGFGEGCLEEVLPELGLGDSDRQVGEEWCSRPKEQCEPGPGGGNAQGKFRMPAVPLRPGLAGEAVVAGVLGAELGKGEGCKGSLELSCWSWQDPGPQLCWLPQWYLLQRIRWGCPPSGGGAVGRGSGASTAPQKRLPSSPSCGSLSPQLPRGFWRSPLCK